MARAASRRRLPTSGLGAFERVVVLVVGCGLVAALGYLVLRGEPVPPSLSGPLKLLISISAGVMGAFLPGATMSVRFTGRGLAIRGAGGAAFFLIAWFGVGTVPALDPPTLHKIPLMDLRSELPRSSGDYKIGKPILVVPIGFSMGSGAKSIRVSRLEGVLTYGEQTKVFSALYFTELKSGGPSEWLPNKGSFDAPQNFDGRKGQEIAFALRSADMTWANFFRSLDAENASRITFEVSATTEAGTVRVSCSADLSHWLATVHNDAEYSPENPPSWMEMPCESS